MDVAAFAKVLVEYAEQIDDVTPLITERDALFVRLSNGEDSKTLVNVAPVVGAKSYGYQVTMTLEEKFQAYIRAIKIFNGAAGSSPVTFFDFSQMNGGGCVPPASPIC